MGQTINELFDTLSTAFHHNTSQLADMTIHSPCTFLRHQGTEIINNQHDALQSMKALLHLDSEHPINDIRYQLLNSKALTSHLSLVKLEWTIQLQQSEKNVQRQGSYFVIEEQQQSMILSVIVDDSPLPSPSSMINL